MQIEQLAGEVENPSHQAGFGWQFVDWKPTDSRAECCGEQCDLCTGSDTTWWCEGSEAGTLHWPYTWGDCEMSFAVRTYRENGGYCVGSEGIRYPHEVDCSFMAEPNAERKEFMLQRIAVDEDSQDGSPFEFFEADVFAWTHYFNKGINKLSALGATWGNNVVRPSLSAVDECPSLRTAALPVPSAVDERPQPPCRPPVANHVARYSAFKLPACCQH